MEGCSTYIGTASTLYCRRAKIIITSDSPVVGRLHIDIRTPLDYYPYRCTRPRELNLGLEYVELVSGTSSNRNKNRNKNTGKTGSINSCLRVQYFFPLLISIPWHLELVPTTFILPSHAKNVRRGKLNQQAKKIASEFVFHLDLHLASQNLCRQALGARAGNTLRPH